jgi:DHA1 family inner membrane transport protein
MDPDIKSQATPLPLEVLWVAGGLALIATVIAGIVPAFIGTWQVQYGIGADRAAFVVAAEFIAQVAGAGVFILASRQWSWRQCAWGGLAVVMAGNLASALSPNLAALIPARTLAGLGGGVLRALGMTCLARALSPGLAFAIYATAQVAIAAVVTAALPAIIAAVGVRGPFVAIAAIAGAALLSTHLLPPAKTATRLGDWRKIPPLTQAGSWAIAALFVYFVGQGALWTFLDPIGRSRSIDPAGITRALTLLNVAGLIGTFGVGALAHRVRPMSALAVLSAIGLVSMLALFNTHTSTQFIIAACGFYFAWCASFPFQFSIIARADSTGTASAAVPAVDTLGLASGAALAGLCLPHLGVIATGWIWAAGSSIGISCFAVAVRARRNAIAASGTALPPHLGVGAKPCQ